MTNFGGFGTKYAMATMNISLPDEMKLRVELRVTSGFYANVSDYVRDLIRDDIERQTWVIDSEMADAIAEGEASGFSDRPIREALQAAKSQFTAT